MGLGAEGVRELRGGSSCLSSGLSSPEVCTYKSKDGNKRLTYLVLSLACAWEFLKASQ